MAALAMLGGFNIEDSYFAPPAENGWEDLGFTVEGPVVARIGHWFDQLEAWTRAPHAQFCRHPPPGARVGLRRRARSSC